MFDGKITEQKDILHVLRSLQQSGINVIFGPQAAWDENTTPYVTIAYGAIFTYEMKQDGIEESIFIQDAKAKLIEKFLSDTKECSFIKFRNLPSVSLETDELSGHKFIIFHVRLITDDYSRLIIKKEGDNAKVIAI